MNEKMTRRDFLKLVGVAGGGLVLAVTLDACTLDQIGDEVTTELSTPLPTSEPLPPFDWSPDIHLKVDSTGTLTVVAFRSEMGQGIRTALAMLVTEELDMEWDSVRIEQAPADSRFGNQVTGGSASINSYYSTMRKAGATARQMLVNAAAAEWDVEPTQCMTEAGSVIHPDGEQKIPYGDLVEMAAEMDIPRNVELKDESQFKIVGTDIGHWDTRDILTGKAVYGLDVRLPDMFFATVARCPVFDGKFINYDDTAALAVPGVKHVVPLNDRIAVVAENSWAAIQGRNSLDITWDEGWAAELSSESIFAEARDRVSKAGSAPEGSLDAVYEIPYEAHATMEPMNCTAYVHDDICEIWAPTQNPQEVQVQVARATGFSLKNVTVNLPLIGGGFGRRLEADYAVEAAQLSQAINAPVQVFWTRDDDIQHDYYHPLSVQYVRASLFPVTMPRIKEREGEGIPTGAWRSVFNFTEAYALQSFIDEMAVALERDPLELRLELYDGRAAEVIKLAAEKANWGEALPHGHGRGLAFHATFGETFVAQVAEISVDESGNISVSRVVCAVDCGRVVNPDTIVAQISGGIAFGLTAALKAEATIKDGRTQQSNFHDYPILQIDEMPVVEVHIIQSDEHPTGIGEMGVPPIAPAVANAVYAATGVRVRHIPIRPVDLR